MHKRIVILSNRLPLNINKRKEDLLYQHSAGGLATGLSSLKKAYELLWLGWPGYVTDSQQEQDIIHETLKSLKMQPLFLRQEEVENYYEGFSNKTIWPLFHYFTQYVIYDIVYWKAYQRVNQLYADALLKMMQEDDLIWVHDYHLMLVPGMVRAERPTATIGYFLHIPFPSFEIFRTLPWRKELISGLLGADLVGFHTFDYASHFTSAAVRLFGLEQSMMQLIFGDRIVQVDSYPMGIDFEKFSDSHRNPQVKKEMSRLKPRVEGRKIILSIDRLDYSKGILQRLMGFKLFLEQYPEFHEKIEFLMVVVPSRSKVEAYQALRLSINEWVGRINGEFGRIGWTPIAYLYRSFSFPSLAALYKLADVCLVTPFRDGMNLVAKEYIACKSDNRGALILSEMAGAAEELREAIQINPNDIQAIGAALYSALTMPVAEQQEKISKMSERLRKYNIIRWSNDYIEALIHANLLSKAIREKEIVPAARLEIIKEFINSKHPVVFLDYDGTLRAFEDTPEKAFPDDELLKLLTDLPRDEGCNCVVISGRGPEILEKWLGHLPFHLVAEHGALIRLRGQDWRPIETIDRSWKNEIRAILDYFVVRTPGSWIEEKEYSLVWHYRKSDIGLADRRVQEFYARMASATTALNLHLLQGAKVIEIKNAGIHKGRAAMEILAEFHSDFILAIGDDWTDEYLFKALPENAHTIKVGITATSARYCLVDVEQVRDFLRVLSGAKSVERQRV